MRDDDDQMYIYKLHGISQPRRLKAINYLRQKIGPNATITDHQIEQAQDIIDNPRMDFTPYALDRVKDIEDAVDFADDVSYMPENMMDGVLRPLMQIKGQAAMFGNPLATELSARILYFLERYKRLDKGDGSIGGLFVPPDPLG